MKDRSPKFPGRVKLLPVSGQENIYDMTRADDPDDTGTPFNTRTMLQDSTARFLRLPVSNPFVDDALRHMPDRIEPIGTVKTSPALSLGGAWLPCDGSQVTFSEYPQLCQILRNTVGTVTWDSEAVGVEPAFKSMTKPIFFKGKWYIGGSYDRKPTNTTNHTYTINIASADSILGPYTIIETKSVTGRGTGALAQEEIDTNGVNVASTDDLIAFAFEGSGETTQKCAYIVWSEDGETWSTPRAVSGPNITTSHVATPTFKDFSTNGTYWVMGDTLAALYLTDIKTQTTWQYKTLGYWNLPLAGQLSYIDGTWFACRVTQNSTPTVLLSARDPSGEWSSATVDTSKKFESASNIVKYSNMYWMLIAGQIPGTYLARSSNLQDWIIEQVSGLTTYSSGVKSGNMAASEKQMAVSTDKGVFTTSDPNVGWSQVTLPASAPMTNLTPYEDILLTTGANAIAYHDYSTETRLLPTISLSSDTTTYIKAKNELDVFEAQESGGD